ncbi:MAG: hypothetical protein EXR81_00465, partial [Gammaproteobacteria bacterium]|nr:hypothetical protein [Gammaproteobacteria bacterium]
MNKRPPVKTARRPYNDKSAPSRTASPRSSTSQPRPQQAKPPSRGQTRSKNQGAYIDPKRFVNTNVVKQEEIAFVSTHAFTD